MHSSSFQDAWQHRRGRIRICAILLAVTLWSVFAINLAAPGAVARNGHVKGEDYAHFYVLGRLVRDGQAALLYDTFGQGAYLPEAIPGAPLTYFIPVYGPQVALLFRPLASLTYLPSYALWTMVTIALYLACCYTVWRTCGALRPYRTEALLLVIASPGLWQLVLHGQNSAVAMASLTGGWLLFRRGRHILAGLALGVLFYKPQLGVAATVVFVLTRHWGVLAGMGLSAAAQILVAWLLLGRAVILEYVAMLARLSGIVELIEPKLYQMHSFRAFFTLLLGSSPYTTGLILLCSIAVLLVVVCRLRSQGDSDIGFAGLIIATLLVSPHTTVYDLVILSPALLLLADRLAAGSIVTGPEEGTRFGWILLFCAFVAPLLSPWSKLLHFQPSVICLSFLLLCCGPGLRLPAHWRGMRLVPGAVGKQME